MLNKNTNLKNQNILIPLFTLFTFSVGLSQEYLPTLANAKNYLVDEWTLDLRCSGWGGCDEFPNDSLDFKLILSDIFVDSNLLDSKLYLNDSLIKSNTIDLDTLHVDGNVQWIMNGFPDIQLGFGDPFYLGPSVSLDTLLTSDLIFDGIWFQYIRSNFISSSINKKPSSLDLKIWPNPMFGNLLNLESEPIAKMNVRVVNSFGINVDFFHDQSQNVIRFEKIPKGVYFLSILGENGTATIPFYKI